MGVRLLLGSGLLLGSWLFALGSWLLALSSPLSALGGGAKQPCLSDVITR